MKPNPSSEHEWLKQFVGKWTYEMHCDMGPDQPVFHGTGTDVGRMLGELWVVSEMEGNVPGHETMTAVACIGYDLRKQKFIGTWCGSPMDYMFVYEGSLDADRRVLTLDTSGPSFVEEGAIADFQDIYAFNADGTRTLTSRMKMPDGSWFEMMKSVAQRAD